MQSAFNALCHCLGDDTRCGGLLHTPTFITTKYQCMGDFNTTTYIDPQDIDHLCSLKTNRWLSSLRTKSARAVTGRRCPHSGRGKDFLSRQPDFFTETAVTLDRKVEKLFPRWEINRHVEG